MKRSEEWQNQTYKAASKILIKYGEDLGCRISAGDVKSIGASSMRLFEIIQEPESYGGEDCIQIAIELHQQLQQLLRSRGKQPVREYIAPAVIAAPGSTVIFSLNLHTCPEEDSKIERRIDREDDVLEPHCETWVEEEDKQRSLSCDF